MIFVCPLLLGVFSISRNTPWIFAISSASHLSVAFSFPHMPMLCANAWWSIYQGHTVQTKMHHQLYQALMPAMGDQEP